MPELQYTFVYKTHCNMCGTDLKDQIVMGKRLNQSQGLRPDKKIGYTTTICKCNVCGLVYCNPMPKPASIEMHYSVPPESYWVESYFNYTEEQIKSQVAYFTGIFGDLNGKTILDIGAGIGKSMAAFNKGGGIAYGIEPSKPFYDRAISKMSIKPEQLSNTSIEDAEFPDDMFDFISYDVVLEHVYDPTLTLKKVIKWLKPGGKVFIVVPNANWLIANTVNLLYKLRGMDYVTNLSPFHMPYHLTEFTPESFHRNSKIVGYKVVDIKTKVCDTYMPKLLDPILRSFMKMTNTGMELNVYLTK
jgi:SAM-dependent methyltransferase